MCVTISLDYSEPGNYDNGKGICRIIKRGKGEYQIIWWEGRNISSDWQDFDGKSASLKKVYLTVANMLLDEMEKAKTAV